MRVWELAERLRITTAELIALIEPYDRYVTSHLATIPEIALRAIQADAPSPTRQFGDYHWHASPPATPAAVPNQPGRSPVARRRRRPRRRPGPAPVSFEPPFEMDDDGWANDPTKELQYEPTWSTRDVAHYFQVKPATVRKWVDRGYLVPDGRQGSSHVFARDDVFAAAAAIGARRKEAGRPSFHAGAPTRKRGLTSHELDRLAKVRPDSLVTPTEAAAMLGLSPATIRSWIRRGHLRPHRTSTSRRTLIPVADLYEAARR